MNQVFYRLCFIICCSFILTACENKSPIDDSLGDQEKATTIENNESVPNAKKLRDVIGQVGHTSSSHKDETRDVTISSDAKPFVGRYQAKVDCSDKIIHCDGGKADIVLNLLPDGTAHRTIIHLGQIMYASNLQYSQDKWIFDKQTHEIVIERNNGVKFFFNTDHPNQLIMNASKVVEVNKAFFESGNPEPMRDYVLTKDN